MITDDDLRVAFAHLFPGRVGLDAFCAELRAAMAGHPIEEIRVEFRAAEGDAFIGVYGPVLEDGSRGAAAARLSVPRSNPLPTEMTE